MLSWADFINKNNLEIGNGLYCLTTSSNIMRLLWTLSDDSMRVSDCDDLTVIARLRQYDSQRDGRLKSQLAVTQRILAATLRGSRPGVQSASVIMTSLTTS